MKEKRLHSWHLRLLHFELAYAMIDSSLLMLTVWEEFIMETPHNCKAVKNMV